jgi:hypothetical protein
MTTADTTALLDATKCYGCFGLSVAELLELGLLRKWLLSINAAADTSAATLLTSVNCVVCFGASLFELLKIALLSAIRDAL